MSEDLSDRAYWEASEEGAELLREGDLTAAVDELSAVIARQPDNPYAHFFLANALFEGGEPLRALKGYLRAVELKPGYLGALIGAGWALHRLGRYREALRVGRQVFLQAKEDPDALHLLGLCHYAMGDSAASLAYLQRFLATQPELEIAYEVDGLIKVLRGEVQALPEGGEEEDDDD